ncbi:MAG: hypothetical protein H6659_13895 [Ardenticatenaceae bacterium]|nr:hypothetical protein [Ardenticatenaceae bacterium]MCB8987827.1 hypothetical protein [Ardenticatenaceae bacterium]
MTQEPQAQQNDSYTTITNALAAGAVAMLRPNLWDRPGKQKEFDAVYLKLKKMIQTHYPQVDVDLLDIGPGSPARRQVVDQQLRTTGAAEDATVIRQAEAVMEILAKIEPSALWASQTAEEPPHLRES